MATLAVIIATDGAAVGGRRPSRACVQVITAERVETDFTPIADGLAAMSRSTRARSIPRLPLLCRRHPIRLRPSSPNLNAYAERFVRSIKSECAW
jgi:hypothetical protein